MITVDLLRQILDLLQADPKLAAAVAQELGPDIAGARSEAVEKATQIALGELAKITGRLVELETTITAIEVSDARIAMLNSLGRHEHANGALHQ